MSKDHDKNRFIKFKLDNSFWQLEGNPVLDYVNEICSSFKIVSTLKTSVDSSERRNRQTVVMLVE